MANCDICNAAMDVDEGTAYTIEELQQMINRGLGPPDKVVQAARSAGWTMEQIITRWRQELDARPQPYWTLCTSCAARAAKYLPAVEAPAGPAEPAPPPEVKPIAPVPPPPSPEAAEPAPPAEAPGQPEPLPAEEPAPEETPALAPSRPRKPAPAGRTFLIGLLIGLLGGGGLFLLVRDRLPSVLPTTPVATVATAAPVTPLPTRPFPTRRPATPRPTEFLYPPTIIPVGDLSGAVLEAGDLPQGFRAMTEAEWEGLGVTDNTAAYDLGYAQARGRHLVSLRYPRTSEFVLSFLLYALTEEEQAAFDRNLSPAAGLELVSAVLTQLEFSAPARLDGLDGLGDKSIGITVKGVGDTATLRMDLVVVRRGAVVEVLMMRYVDGREPRMAPEEAARLLDERVARALGK